MTTRRLAALGLACALSSCSSIMISNPVWYSPQQKAAFLKSVDTVGPQSFALLGLYLILSQPGEPPSAQEMREKWLPKGVQHWVESLYVRGKDARLHYDLTGKAQYWAKFNEINNYQLYRPALALGFYCEHAGGALKHVSGSEYRLTPADELFTTPGLQRDTVQYGAMKIYAQIVDANTHHAFGQFNCVMPDNRVAWSADVEIPISLLRPGNHLMVADTIQVNTNLLMQISAYTPVKDKNPKFSVAHLDVMAREAAIRNGAFTERYGDLEFEAWPTESLGYNGCRQVLSRVKNGDKVLQGYLIDICKSR